MPSAPARSRLGRACVAEWESLRGGTAAGRDVDHARWLETRRQRGVAAVASALNALPDGEVDLLEHVTSATGRETKRLQGFLVRVDGSRPHRGCHVDRPWTGRGGAAAAIRPWTGRGGAANRPWTGRGPTAAATRIVRGRVASPPRLPRGPDPAVRFPRRSATRLAALAAPSELAALIDGEHRLARAAALVAVYLRAVDDRLSPVDAVAPLAASPALASALRRAACDLRTYKCKVWNMGALAVYRLRDELQSSLCAPQQFARGALYLLGPSARACPEAAASSFCVDGLVRRPRGNPLERRRNFDGTFRHTHRLSHTVNFGYHRSTPRRPAGSSASSRPTRAGRAPRASGSPSSRPSTTRSSASRNSAVRRVPADPPPRARGVHYYIVPCDPAWASSASSAEV